jgi:iron-only hydrogenase group A
MCKLESEFLKMKGKGHKFEVVPDRERVCIYCGQCITHCPAGAFESVGEFEGISEAFTNKNKKIIFQIAPAARVSISEEFGLKPGTVSTGKLITGLKKIGVDQVYDVAVGADLTTMEEVNEFIERFSEDDLPMFTSCCPAWVRFVEFYYPQFVDNLTTVRSPHIILGGLIKDDMGWENTTVVSVMPCVAKKYEISREELWVEGKKPVDYVLTVREIGRLFRDNNINFKKLEESEFDDPFGLASGDGVGYGFSGGVMQAALKEVLARSGKNVENIEFKDGENLVNFKDKKVKTKKISGISEMIKTLELLKENPKEYDYLEIMACPGGCIGGGGQPIPTTKKIVQKRKEGLMKAAKGKKMATFENKKIKDFYNKNARKELFRTSFKARKNPEAIDST